MAAKPNATKQVDDLRHVIEGVAKNFADRVYGPQGPEWGTRFADIEEFAVQIGQAVSRHMCDQALQRQADQPPPPVCPGCGAPARKPNPNHAWSRRGPATPNGKNRIAIAVVVAGLFFPQLQRLGIDRGGYSPAVLQRLVYAGVHHSSFERARDALRERAGLSISAQQVERLTQRMGEERCSERDAAVDGYQALPLTERKAAPAGVVKPDLAVVEVDGGRLQILDRGAAEAASVPGEAAASAGHWREDKIGLLATMDSKVSTVDPCPTIPEGFVDPLRILKWAQEIKGSMGGGAAATTDLAATAASVESATYTAPELNQRSVAATRQDVYAFGPILAEAAWTRGFYQAERRAFVADGSSTNGGVWERHFSSFTPIVDFIHALSYVFQAALAGRSFTLGWPAYTEWIQSLWSGQVEQVIAALVERQRDLGPPTADEPETSPRHRVAEALGYLQNQKERMRYATFRQQGLPITSSHIESTIKQINRRVKGTEKFWSSSGAEAILQLRADAISETAPLEGFWERRQARATGRRRYKAAG